MFLLILSLWTISGILIYVNPKNEPSKWLSAICFTIGLGSLSVEIHDSLIPYVMSTSMGSESIVVTLRIVVGVFASVAHYFAPYGFLLFSISFSEIKIYSFLRNKILAIAASALPIFWMYSVIPIYPEYTPDDRLLAIWTVPYIFTSCWLLVFSCLRENNRKKRQRKILISILVAPGALLGLALNILLPAFGVMDLWRNMPYFIYLVFIYFIFCVIKFDVFGIKLKFEKVRLNTSMKAVTAGTRVLTQTIDTDVNRIDELAQNLGAYSDSLNPSANNNIRIILNSTSHLVKMIEKIREQLQDIQIVLCPNSINRIVDYTIDLVRPYFENKQITVEKKYEVEGIVLCDEIHVVETLSNLFRNAVDAMNANGNLLIRVYQTRKNICISVTDDGKGISKANLSHVIDPFFSTKKTGLNFGLGLSYCHNIMQMHEGSLEVISEENKGTTVLLEFPKSKVVETVKL